MNLSLNVEGETFSVDFNAEGRINKKRWTKKAWYWSKDGHGLGFMLTTPLFYLNPHVQGFKREQEPPKYHKYGRAKRFSITFEHGYIPGYKE